MPYKQSKQYLRNFAKYVDHPPNDIPGIQLKLLQHVLSTSPANNPQAILESINQFCKTNWMMNIGEEKGDILIRFLKETSPKNILELGGYCGFSALLMAANSEAVIHTIEPSKMVADVAHRIHQHAGLADRIFIHIGVLQTLTDFVKNHGTFDFIFIDHVKHLYLPDFKELQQLGVVKEGTLVFGDNIIFPGSPDYLQYFKHSDNYDSTLYHSYLEYSNRPDAVLVSRKITP